MTDDLKIEEQYIKGYELIDGKEIPIIHCPTKVTVIDKKTGIAYASEKEAQQDVINPDTDTTETDLQKDLTITVAHLQLFGDTR